MTAAAALDDRQFRLPFSLESKPVDNIGAGGLWRQELRVSENEFPFEFGRLKTEVSSPVESDESDEDEFFAKLTQRMCLSESRNGSAVDFNIQKSPVGLKVSGGSPQSTLGGIGSWSGRSSNESNHNSPPATPFESDDDTLGLIYAAAGQVAKLERNVEDPLQAAISGQWRAVAKPKQVQNPNAGFYAELELKQKYIAAARQASEAALFWEHQLQNIKISETLRNSGYGVNSELLTRPATRPHFPQAKVAMKPNCQAIPLQRKESAGTGVFIPRRYDSNSSVPPRKRIVAPCALVPPKVVMALNTTIESMSASSRPHSNPFPTKASLSQQSYDALMARRRALLDQQQRSMTMTEDISPSSLEACLPQEWSY